MSFVHPWLLLLLLAPAGWLVYEWNRTARRLALILKMAAFVAIIIALAQPQTVISSTKLAMGVLVDTSASVPTQDLERASQIIATLDRNRGSNTLRVIPFARASRAADSNEGRRPWKLRSTAGEAGRASDLEAALREALSSLPPGQLPRLALFSDGKENKGSVARAAWQANQLGIPIDTYAFTGKPTPAVRLESMTLPPQAFTGEPFSIDLVVSAPKTLQAEVELLAEGHSLGKTRVTLNGGPNPIRMKTSLETPGALDLSVAIRTLTGDVASGELRFDQAITLRRPRALYFSSDPSGIDSHFPSTLSGAQFEVDRVDDLGKINLASYQLLVLNNIDLDKVPDPRKNDVEKFVQQGGGLLVLSGERNVYDDKKKTEHALDRTLPAKLLPPQSAEGTVVVMIVDKSSSMEGPKMELAKAAATGLVTNLRPIDEVGILIFDNSNRWAVPIRKADEPASITRLIAGISPDGGTQIAPALTEAYQKILTTAATYRHVLLLTDGISEEGNAYAIARDAKEKKVTISTIGLGNDVHREYLEQIAKLADGTFYPVRDPSGLQQIVLRDVMEHTGATTVEKPLKANAVKQKEILQNIDIGGAPALKGFVRFETKPGAETILEFGPREPLLTRWQYGLGRAAVFASDAKSRWAADWVTWKSYTLFWTNVARDLLPHTQGAEATLELDNANSELVATYRLAASAVEPAKIPDIYAIGPDNFRKQMEVVKTAAGTYRGRVGIGARQGLFRIRPLEETQVFPEIGLYRPETELNDYGSNPTLLKQVAEYTGGRFQPDAKAAFDAGARSLATTLQWWPGLLALGVILNLAELILRKWKGLFVRA